ncbi:MAG TPA: hypothetical protein VFS21_39245 [Roseiflexaceae bacterium]|nr:hypothetical protein [Roseiflexaceae bacterium]
MLSFSDPITSRIVEFLRGIGLAVQSRDLSEPTFLPGILIENGGLVIDERRLLYPGDLLHEAGHLAVAPGALRPQLGGNVTSDPTEEIMAIAWSYAAAVQLGLDLQVVFHAGGYKGGNDSLIENFTAGRYIGLPMLQWVGMALDERRANKEGQPPYPHMLRWLRE